MNSFRRKCNYEVLKFVKRNLGRKFKNGDDTYTIVGCVQSPSGLHKIAIGTERVPMVYCFLGETEGKVLLNINNNDMRTFDESASYIMDVFARKQLWG